MLRSDSVIRIAAVLAASVVAANASATNGYFSHGYGNQSKGAAGVAAALPQDALVTATNPAGLLFVGDRLDLGVDVFLPRRNAKITGNLFGADESFSGNDSQVFYIPEFGYSRQLSDDMAVGLAVYGNGGINTDYADNPFARFGATGSAGVNMEQLFISPAAAWRLTPNSSFGIAVNLAYQRFSAKGLGPFAAPGVSVDPANVTNNGRDDSTGWGVRVGWQGSISERVDVGLSWQSKTRMSEFDDYSGLFPNGGEFDIAENYVLGAAFEATDALTLAMDWQRILYSDTPAAGNSAFLLFADGIPLGSKDGPGFGWRDIDVIKLAAVYQASESLTLRAGFSHTEQPIPQKQTFFNILAPGVVQQHASLGATWQLNASNALTFAYTHAFGEWVRGAGSIPPGLPPGFGGGEADVYLQEDIFGLSWNLAL
ncbi:OmpP1/FadL family transporter [Alcanivorax sp. 1008]|uniref:OmpP1/FadL family transporter n=1 Tax=Alcanivorax sp. 1008 TaxID=2816853 RepID=UPI001D9C3855|nr:outer membrane protein transport protein [Alcanivorax sp. 1008]MCC1495544.1 outer membrane protein transport protein [Alcanivorax sp. 1008]